MGHRLPQALFLSRARWKWVSDLADGVRPDSGPKTNNSKAQYHDRNNK